MIFKYISILEKQSRINHFWSLSPQKLQDSLTHTWKYLPAAGQAFLSLTWKSIPNLPELFKGAIIGAEIRIMMGPLEKTLGDNPTLFTVFRNALQIYVIKYHYMPSGDSIGGGGVQYSGWHLWAAITTFSIKAMVIGQQLYSNILNDKIDITGMACFSEFNLKTCQADAHNIGKSLFKEDGLIEVTTKANYYSEYFARGLWMMADNQHNMEKNDESAWQFIYDNGQLSWALQALVGSQSRMYVADNAGKTLAKASGLSESMRNIGNNVEIYIIKHVVDDGSISFANKDDIYTKGWKLANCLNSPFEYIKMLVMVPVVSIDFLARLIPEVTLGLPLVALTRLTANIFEKHVRFVTEHQSEEPTNVEYFFESLVISAAFSSLFSEVINDIGRDIALWDSSSQVLGDWQEI